MGRIEKGPLATADSIGRVSFEDLDAAEEFRSRVRRSILQGVGPRAGQEGDERFFVKNLENVQGDEREHRSSSSSPSGGRTPWRRRVDFQVPEPFDGRILQ